MDLTSSNLNVSTAYLDRLNQIDGVGSTVAVGRYITPSPKGRFGIQQLDGVDWKPFAAMNGMELVDGREPAADNEVILDERQMKDDKLKLGDEIDLFGKKKYTVVGVFAPPSGSRIKMSLTAMQNIFSTLPESAHIFSLRSAKARTRMPSPRGSTRLCRGTR